MYEYHEIGLKLTGRGTAAEYHLIGPKVDSSWYTVDTYSVNWLKLINTLSYTVDEYSVILQTGIKRQSDNATRVVMPC